MAAGLNLGYWWHRSHNKGHRRRIHLRYLHCRKIARPTSASSALPLGLGSSLDHSWGGEFGLRVPFFAAAGLATFNLVLGYFVVPETVTNNTRHPFDLKRTNPLRALTQIQKITDLSRFLLLFFLYQFAFYVYPAIWVYFAKAQFNWGSAMVSISLASFGISVAVVEGILIRHILPWLGERRTIELGPVFNIRIFIVLGLLTSGFWALLLAPISALGSLVIPAMRGIMANKAATNQQGEIQGIISSTQSLAVIFAPLVLTYVFYAGTPPNGPVFLPGAPFLLAAAIVALTLIIIVTRQKSSIGIANSCRKVSQNLLHLSIHSVALL